MYSKNGEWQRIKPDLGDVFLTFFPIMNIPSALDYVLLKLKKWDLNKFFKIEK